MFPPALDPSEFLLAEPPGLGTKSTPRLRPGGMELCDMVQSFLTAPESVGKDLLRGLLHQFDKNQLIELILTSAVDREDSLQTVRGLIASSTTFRRLLVRNIPFSASSDAVKLLLARFGDVEEGAVVFDRTTGRSKGFAFATFSDVSDACKAVSASLREEISMENRTVFLKFAADRNESLPGLSGSSMDFVHTPTPSAGGGGSLISGVGGAIGVKLFVYNLSPLTTSESLRVAFSPFGEISECAVVCDPQGRSKRFAFVTFLREEDAWKCLQEPNRTIDGRMTFTHLASEGRVSRMVSSGQTGGLRTPSFRTPRGEREVPPQHVFTPQGGAGDSTASMTTPQSLLNESLLSQWIAELTITDEVQPSSAEQTAAEFPNF